MDKESQESGSVCVFGEDRKDVAWRVLPRAFLGGYVLWLGLVLAATFVPGHDPGESPPVVAVFGLPLLFTSVAVATRFDVWAYQWGRPVRYEISGEDLKVFVGDNLRESIKFDDVDFWFEVRSPSPRFFWTGLPLYRSIAMPEYLDGYSFQMRTLNSSGLPRLATPPMLFRWRDRGGVEDVTEVLRNRIGAPGDGSWAR